MVRVDMSVTVSGIRHSGDKIAITNM
jgi:hypothetical protein